MSIKDLDVFRFVQLQAQTCYQLTAQAQGVRRFYDGRLSELLAVHLDERVWFTLQTTLRVLAAQDQSGRMKKIAKGVFSADKRQRSNSLEAMDDILEKSLVRLLTPLLDDLDVSARIAAGKRLFPNDLLQVVSGWALFDDLLSSRNWVTLVLALTLIRQQSVAPEDPIRIQALVRHDNLHVSLAATELLEENGFPIRVGERNGNNDSDTLDG
jgi:hypothetical protein